MQEKRKLLSRRTRDYVCYYTKQTDGRTTNEGQSETRGILTERREKSTPGRLIDFTVDRKSNDGSGWCARGFINNREAVLPRSLVYQGITDGRACSQR